MQRTLIWLLMLIYLIFNSFQGIAKEKKIYVYTDENGVIAFSDKPLPGAKEVNLNRSTLTMPATNTDIFKQLQNQDEGQPAQYQVIIDEPQEQATLRDNRGEFAVRGHILPSFRSGFKVQLLLDGKPHQKPHSKVIFSLKNIDRGEHTLVLQLLDESGNIVASSTPRIIYLFRASAIKAGA